LTDSESIPLLSDADLVRLARADDPKAWEQIVVSHQEPVFRLSYLVLGDPDDAADNAQETFLRARRFFYRFDDSRPLRPWLLGIAGNLARNRLRSAGRFVGALKRLAGSLQGMPSTAGEAERRIERDRLWQAIRRLPVADQRVIFLRYYLDLSVAETADAEKVAPGTIKSRLSRALARLRVVIETDFPDLEIP